jgi:hypothetical protein
MKNKIETYEQLKKRREGLMSYSVEQLEEMILKRWKVSKEIEFDNELSDYLYVRKRKINDTFEWTPENMEKLIRLNQKLIECWEKLDAEARQTLKTIKKRMDESDKFLHDFNMDAVVEASIYVPDEDGEFGEAEDGIEEVLNCVIHNNSVVNCRGYSFYDIDKPPSENIYLDPEQNWNRDISPKGKFDGYFISQAIHDLYHHTCWSFPDILRINSLWTELHVDYQNFVKF